jgi:hypothetical protein
LANLGAVVAIVVLGIGLSIAGSEYVVTSSNLSADQSQITYLQEHPSTTLTSTLTTTQYSTLVSSFTTTSVYSTTFTTLQTVTTTSSIYPPSNSSYALTFVSGNATSSGGQAACSVNYQVDATYELHQSIPNSGVVVWVKYPDGEVTSTSPKMFPNQAYVTLDAGFYYQFNACGGNWANVVTWVTDTSNKVLSPTTNLVTVSG